MILLEQAHEPQLRPLIASTTPVPFVHPRVGPPQRIDHVEHVLLSHLPRLVRPLQQRQQAPHRLKMQRTVVKALVPAAPLRQSLELFPVIVASQDPEDADRDALYAFPPLKHEVAEMLEEHPVALAARLVAGEDPVEVEAEVHAEAEEVLRRAK